MPQLLQSELEAVQASGDYYSWFAARLRNFAEDHVGYENAAGTKAVGRNGLECASAVDAFVNCHKDCRAVPGALCALAQALPLCAPRKFFRRLFVRDAAACCPSFARHRVAAECS